MNKQKICMSLVLVFVLLLSGFINAVDEGTLNEEDLFEQNEDLGYSISDAGVRYDKGIESKFLYQDRVYVSILLKDNSGIVFNGTKEERREQLKLQEIWFENKMNKFISDLDEKDFIYYRNSAFSVSGFISKNGFEKLKDMEEIVAIEIPGGGQGQSLSIFHLHWFIYLFLFLILIILIFIKLIKKRKHAKKN